MNEDQAWERQPGETAIQYAWFCVYRDMGPGRSLRKAAASIGKDRSLLDKYSGRLCWVSRCAAWDAHCEQIARRKAEQEHADEMAAFRRRMRAEARDFGSVAHAALAVAGKALLKMPETMTPGEAASLLRAAAAVMEQSINAEAEAVGVRALEGVLLAHETRQERDASDEDPSAPPDGADLGA